MVSLLRRLGLGLLVVMAIGTASILADAPDWPQFRGPGGTGKSTETGLLKSWPDGGPKLLWKLEGLGRGYSTLSIVGGKFYTMGDRRGDGGEAQFVLAYDLADRKELWAAKIGPPHGDGGPRCTPTVDGDRVYAIGTDGDLACLKADNGEVVWHKNFAKDFDGRMMSVWRFSESPLVDGEKLVCTPGGPDATLVALNKLTGEVIWKCAVPDIGNRGKNGAGYSTMVAADIEGTRQYVQILGRGAVGIDAKTGKFLWGYNKIANGVANIPTPVVRDNLVFVTTSYKTGSALLKIVKDGDDFKAEEVYFKTPREFENHHGGVILVGDYIYGGDGQNNGTPVCLEFATGKIAWRGKPAGNRSAAIVYADGNFVFRYEDGTVALVEANPQKYVLKSKFKAPVVNGPAWPYPVIHDGKLYLRANDTLMCYDINAK